MSTARTWLTQLIELLDSKKGRNQIQDFIWRVYQTKLELDTDAVATSLAKGKDGAHVQATVEGIHTIASLALLNKGFRVFTADVEHHWQTDAPRNSHFRTGDIDVCC